MQVETLRWNNGRLELIDQRRLPLEFVYVACEDAEQTANAIRDMVVRGAPAIGCTAAYGVAVDAQRHANAPRAQFDAALERSFKVLEASRPTAVNLFWAITRMRERHAQSRQDSTQAAAASLLALAQQIHIDDVEICRAIGRHGAQLIADGARIMTHCNAGALATAGHGTALGVIRSARDAGKHISVISNETRPYLQGARLTAWEMVQENIPVTLVTDNMAGHLMQRGRVDVIVVGADRIAANGDTANKIGTYTLAVLAERHGIPFYIAAPTSTLDPSLPNGDGIPVEERSGTELTEATAPEGTPAFNPAFDVTPGELISAIVTEQGTFRAPYDFR